MSELSEAYINLQFELAKLPVNQTPEIQEKIARNIGEVILEDQVNE